jgi:hypothetical protein
MRERDDGGAVVPELESRGAARRGTRAIIVERAAWRVKAVRRAWLGLQGILVMCWLADHPVTAGQLRDLSGEYHFQTELEGAGLRLIASGDRLLAFYQSGYPSGRSFNACICVAEGWGDELSAKIADPALGEASHFCSA